MKAFSTLGIVLLAGLWIAGGPARAQQTAPSWQRATRLGSASASVQATATDAVGNTYVVGSFFGTAQFGSFTFTSPGSSSSGDGYLLKLDAQGTVLWARQITGMREETMAAVALDGVGNVTVAGTLQYDATFDALTTLRGATAISPDLFVARYDPTGTLLWARSYGGPLDNVDMLTGSGVAVDAAGNTYVAGGLLGSAMIGGVALNNSAARKAPVLLKLTTSGTVSWAQQGQLAGTTSATLSSKTAVSVDAAGNAVLGGTFSGGLSWGGTVLQTVANRTEVFVTRFNAAGNSVWAQQSSSTANAHLNAIGLDAAGNAYVAGEYEGSTTFGALTLATAGQTDGYIVKLAPSGLAQWGRSIGGTQTDASQGLALSSGGDVYATGIFTGVVALGYGTTSLTSAGNTDIFVACYTTQGDLRWAQRAGSAGPDLSETVGVDAAGRVYVSGICSGPASFAPLTLTSGGYPLAFTAQLAAQPLATTTARTLHSLTFSPNPATEIVRLGSLPIGSRVVLTNALGRTIGDGVKATSAADPQISVRGLVPGTYLLRATDPTGRQYGGRLLVQ